MSNLQLQNLVREIKILNNTQQNIHKELELSNKLKREELRQQYFFIELIEEVLPLDDGVKRGIHERSSRIMTDLWK